MPFPVDPKFIDEAEVKLAAKFPEAFRAGMAKLNGGEVATPGDLWELHPFFDSSDKKRMARTASHIVRETAVAKEWAGFPAGAVAIASGQGGDIAVMLPDEARQGWLKDMVYRWNHETGAVNILSPTTAIWFNT